MDAWREKETKVWLHFNTKKASFETPVIPLLQYVSKILVSKTIWLIYGCFYQFSQVEPLNSIKSTICLIISRPYSLIWCTYITSFFVIAAALLVYSCRQYVTSRPFVEFWWCMCFMPPKHHAVWTYSSSPGLQFCW